MIYALLKRCIEQKNEFMSADMIKLQIEFFALNGKITIEERQELLDILEPPVVEVEEVVEEGVVEEVATP